MTLVKTGNHVGDTDSLPKWARDYVDRLERELGQVRKDLAEHVERGDFVPGDYLNTRVPTRRTLHAAESPVAWGAIRATFENDDTIEVSTSGHLFIECVASNVAIIRNKDSYDEAKR